LEPYYLLQVGGLLTCFYPKAEYLNGLTTTLLKSPRRKKMKTVYHNGELIPADEWDFEKKVRKPKKISKKAPKVEAETQPGVDLDQE
jgi:hypothetical protein